LKKVDTAPIMKGVWAAVGANMAAGACGVHTQGHTNVYRLKTLGREMGNYVKLIHDYSCGYQYQPNPAQTVKDCATACQQSTSHCTLFSFGGGLGCRISACGYVAAMDTSKPCGYAVPVSKVGLDAETIKHACGTQSYEGSTLYKIPDVRFEVIQREHICGWQYLKEPNAHTESECAVLCKKTGAFCQMFSFGPGGCRIAACNDPKAKAKGKPCGFQVSLHTGSGKAIAHELAYAKATEIKKGCGGDCTVCDADSVCSICTNFKFLLDGNCAPSCPVGHISHGHTERGRHCEACQKDCIMCDQANYCSRCEHSKYLLLGKCIVQCPKGYTPVGTGTQGRHCVEMRK